MLNKRGGIGAIGSHSVGLRRRGMAMVPCKKHEYFMGACKDCIARSDQVSKEVITKCFTRKLVRVNWVGR